MKAFVLSILTITLTFMSISGSDADMSFKSSTLRPTSSTSSTLSQLAAPRLTSVALTTSSETIGETIPSAAEYIESRVAEFDQVLYVYKDSVDGANHFTQKAWMGERYDLVPSMNEAAEGLDGTTGIAASIDFSDNSWGGYMFLNGRLKAGSSVPELDFGNSDVGLDLSGASKLTFYARGEEGGELVEFFMGGLGFDRDNPGHFPDSDRVSLGYVELSNEWQLFEINLKGANLSRIGCGFGWVTSLRSNLGQPTLRFYIDNIRYEFAEPRPGPLFLTSYAPAPPNTDAAVINNFAYVYDQSLAILVALH